MVVNAKIFKFIFSSFSVFRLCLQEMEGLCSFGNGLTAAEAAVAAVAAAAEEQGPAAPEREEEPVPQQLLLPPLLLGPGPP